jgi:hypothetical protein
MPTLLHISDLHRTSNPRVQNHDLLAAIASDANRWAAEGIPRPDVIVVSGDVVQGVSPNLPGRDAEIAAQYAEAEDFITRLAVEFVDGDLARVVVVPGNHDVDWGPAREAMAEIDAGDDIARTSVDAESRVRWSWAERQAYEIADEVTYDRRCDAFRSFRRRLYAGLTPNPLSSGDQLLFFDYPSLGLVIVGFPSWHGNDCFCHVGEIDSRLISQSREMLMRTPSPTAVAVWHHGLTGGPRAQDFMDQRVVHKLIDFGFSLGLHGHQHYPGAAPYELRLPNLTAMTVVGAGSLAVGDSGLPMGERRQYNLVEIHPETESVTVHVRAMSPAGVFTGSHRDDFGGNTFLTLALRLSPVRGNLASEIRTADEAMEAVALGGFTRALQLADELGPQSAIRKRQIQSEALMGLGRINDLLRVLNPPQTADELIRCISALLNERRFDEAAEWLDANGSLLDDATARDLAHTIEATMMTR